MTESTARTVAHIVLVSVGLAAAFVVLTNPPLRRLASRGLRLWLGAGVPTYLLVQTKRAWVESGRAA